MIDAKLVEMLRCPAEGGPLSLLSPEQIAEINQRIARGELSDPLEQTVEQPIEGGLANASGTRVYPIRCGIPTLVADEAIVLTASDSEPPSERALS
jgi:uncharacterized protein YbaR (Trm112 family)